MGDLFTALDWIGALLAAVALAMVAFTHREMRAARTLILVGVGVIMLRWVGWSFSTDASWPVRAIIGAIFGAVLLGGSPALWAWSVHKEALEHQAALMPQPSSVERHPLTMRQVFDSDFSGLAKVCMASRVVMANGDSSYFAFSEIIDLQSNTYFLALYFDDPNFLFEARVDIAGRVANILRQLSTISLVVNAPGSSYVADNTTMSFSKHIYIYIDKSLPYSELSEIQSAFQQYGYSTEIRSDSYLVLHWKEFDRVPVGASGINPASQLPAAAEGTSVTVQNKTGTLPAWSDGDALPPLH